MCSDGGTMTVGVAGLGLLGRGIAACLLAHGARVVALEPDGSTRDDARRHIAGAIGDLIDRGGWPAALRADWPGRYAATADVAEFAACGFVIESIFEDPDAKRDLFAAIEAVVAPATPIASNTSALPISRLQEGRARPGRFIGMHWAEPCHLTRFLEVIRGDRTDDATVAATMDLGRRVGKDPSLVLRDVDGFIVNRIGYAMYREAFWLLENGVADVETIDRSFRNAFSVWADVAGPFRWMDLSGLPAYAAVMERLWPKLSTATEVPEAMKKLVAEGARGIVNGRGFYRYTPEEAAAWERKLVDNVWASRDADSKDEQEREEHP